MSDNPPVVYILHGEDEYAITQFIDELIGKLGDPVFADLNTTRLDGRTASPEEIETAAATLPFMVKRRLVVISNPLARLGPAPQRQRFLALLERVSPAVAVLLVEDHQLTDPRDQRKGKKHWLESWAEAAGSRAYLKSFPMPHGGAYVRRLQEQARLAGGQITPQAAELLASLVGENPVAAVQEIHKLLAYVNYQRSVEIEDVEHLTADQSHGDIFALVDAIGQRDGRRSLDMLHRLLDEQEALSIFGMVVRQFRLLLLAREALDEGAAPRDLAARLKLHPFVAEKVGAQARHFDLAGLERIYHHLLDIDVGIKTGDSQGDVALDTLVAAITA